MSEDTTYDPNGIIAGDHALPHKTVTILSGQGALVRGTVLGLITEGAKTAAGEAGVPAPAAATITAAPPAALNTKVGDHRFVCTVGGAGAASKWNHIDPDGEVVGEASGDTAYAGGGLSALTIADAGTDPVAGETFIVTVTTAAASGKAKLSLTAGVDGSEEPDCILAVDVDATSADIAAPAYEEGQFASEKLTYGTGHSATTVEAAMRAKNKSIYLKSIGAVA